MQFLYIFLLHRVCLWGGHVVVSFGRDILIFYWPDLWDDIGQDPMSFWLSVLVYVLAVMSFACYWLGAYINCQYIFR